MARRQQLASPMSEFSASSAVGVILVFGGSLVFISRSAPKAIAFVAMFRKIHAPRAHLHRPSLPTSIRASRRRAHLLDHDAQSEIQDKPGALELNGLKDK